MRHNGTWRSWAGVVALLMWGATSARAEFIVMPTVTQVGGLYHYDYTVTNTSGVDLFLIDIHVADPTNAVLNLTSPSSDITAFIDPTLGLVSFLDGFAGFGPTPISGLAFDSPFAPGATTFDATFLDDNEDIGTSSGPTLGPLAVVAEPSAFLLIAVGAIPLLACRLRYGRPTKGQGPPMRA